MSDAADSLGSIKSGLATNGSNGARPTLGRYGGYGERLRETIAAVTPHASTEVLRRLGALRESMGGIELAVELASALPKGSVDKPLLDAIHLRSATALAAVLELEELLRAETRSVERNRSLPRKNGSQRSVRPRTRS